MEFDAWEPVYRAILEDFGYERAADEHARDALRDLLSGRPTLDPADVPAAGLTVAVAGAGPSLESDLAALGGADAVFAASTAADRLREQGVGVDCLVTDLDKHGDTAVSLTHEGVPVVAHAHGDNVPLVRAVVPEAATEWLVPTTQAAPRPPVANFGGFTDGDRGAFLADHFDARELRFPGWDFEDPSVGPEKRRKLVWAERLLFWLERRREERFDVLDGRREAIDASALPV